MAAKSGRVSKWGGGLVLFAALTACVSPAPSFFGAERHDITVANIDFTVYQLGERAEVIRRGWLPRESATQIPRLMVWAAERSTGCRVRPETLSTLVPFDPGEMRMSLDCSRRQAGPATEGYSTN